MRHHQIGSLLDYNVAKMPLPFNAVFGCKYRERMQTLAKIRKLAKILKIDFWAFRQFPKGFLLEVALTPFIRKRRTL